MIKKQNKSKKVLILSDLHCGHKIGLTPPDWQSPHDVENETISKYGTFQKEFWEWYITKLKEIGKVDILIINGDTIDGKGAKSKGTELITTDLLEQCDIAVECISKVRTDKIFMTYGTPYHTGDGEDFEDVIANKVKANIKGQHFLDINGLIFDVKHKVGGSTIPHGRATALLRDALWNDLWSKHKNGQPDADVLVRSHVHYHVYVGDSRRLCLTTPGMQLHGSKFGERQCSGTIDIGMILFEIDQNGGYSWESFLLEKEFLKAPIVQA
jgi:hypothetical protein